MVFNRLILSTTAMILVAISVICEVILFTDYANNQTDKIIAGFSAFGLVICQFAFVPLAIKLFKNNKLFSILVSLLVFTLFMVSVAGTASFFESRFANNKETLSKTSNEYLLKQKLVNDLHDQKQLFLDSAERARNEGNNWYAGEQLKEANKVNNQRLELIEQMQSIEGKPSDSGTTLATALDKKRWALWVFMAVLVDLCPIICFASLSFTNDKLIIDKLDNVKTITKNIEKQIENENQNKQQIKQSINNQKYKPENSKPENKLNNSAPITKIEEAKNKRQKAQIETFLKNNNLTQREFCKKYDIKEKHLSLAKNHEIRMEQGKETAPKEVLNKIKTIIHGN